MNQAEEKEYKEKEEKEHILNILESLYLNDCGNDLTEAAKCSARAILRRYNRI